PDVPAETIFCDEEALVRIDWAERRVTRTALRHVPARLHSRNLPLLMGVWTDDRPFERELRSRALRYEGRAQVNGVECHVIHVAYGRYAREARWYLALADGLPRRFERINARDDRESIVIIELANLSTAPVL